MTIVAALFLCGGYFAIKPNFRAHFHFIQFNLKKFFF